MSKIIENGIERDATPEEEADIAALRAETNALRVARQTERSRVSAIKTDRAEFENTLASMTAQELMDFVTTKLDPASVTNQTTQKAFNQRVTVAIGRLLQLAVK